MKFKLTIYAKSVLQLIVVFVLAWFLYTVRGVIIYLIIATLLALIVKPVTNFLSERKIGKVYFPRALAALVAMLLIFVFFGIIGTFLLPTLYSELAVLSKIDFGRVYENSINQFSLLEDWFSQREFNLENIEGSVRSGIENLLSLETIENTISSILGGLGNIAIALFSILFMLFFLLKERNVSTSLLENYLPTRLSEHILNIVPKLKTTLFRYSLGLVAQMTGIFLVVYVGLKIAGVPSAIVIAVFAAFFNLIPYLGPMIGATFGIILGVGQAIALHPESGIALLAGKIVLVFAATQLTDNFVFQPLIFSNSIKAHPLEIFIVISVAGLLGGVIGMIIAVPTYGMLRIVFKEFYADSKFIQALTKNV